MHQPFTLIMSVYEGDDADYFDESLRTSLMDQTVRPDELVLIVDGPIPSSLEAVIEKYRQLLDDRMVVERFNQNKGLGPALKRAVELSTNDLIARMDSDDISVPDRFAQQLEVFRRHDCVDVVGGNIAEFIGCPDNVVGIRDVPVSDAAIKREMGVRCPLNHVTVMYKRKAVIGAGNYENLHYNEDYLLWVRMMGSGCCFANIPSTLCLVRVGADMFARRGGKRYFDSEMKVQRLMLEAGMIGAYRFIINCIKRFIVQILLPNNARGLVYKLFARKPAS